jgi:hypothetical protein
MEKAMAIDPLGSSGIPESNARRAANAPPIRPELTLPTGQRSDAVDTAEVSDEARRLAIGADIPHFTLAAQRLREISQRLADGTYNSDAVVDAIATGIKGDV